MSKALRIAALAAGCGLALTGVAFAQAPAPSSSVREACMSSAQSLCPTEVAAHDRDAVRACLRKNLDKATPACQAAVKTAQPAPAH